MDKIATTTVCKECLQIVPGIITVNDGSVLLATDCPDHNRGEPSTACIEVDEKFYRSAWTKASEFLRISSDTVILNATDRCNQVCKHCYHMPGDDPDPPISELEDRAKNSDRPTVILMGAEPTVRDDLADVIVALKKIKSKVGIYSNVIRLSDKAYLDGLLEAGLDFICVSLHTKTYNNNSTIWDKKMKAMKNIRKSDAFVHHIAFSMSTPEDVDEVLRTSFGYWDMGGHHRIRIPSKIGRCADESFYLSQFFEVLDTKLKEFGWKWQRMYDDDTRYHVNIDIEGKWYRIIRWPSIEEIDLSELHGPPTCQFDDEIGEVNFVHGAIVAAEKKIRAGRT
jgi:sulfatase maturation enzyme AslB (radical SAM superfamily)